VTSYDIPGVRSGPVSGVSLSFLGLPLLLRFVLRHNQDLDSAASNDTIADNSDGYRRKRL
jgi:hypothetical protein